jgi:hypothetical protein
MLAAGLALYAVASLVGCSRRDRFLGWEAVFFVNVPLAGAALTGARDELCAPNERYLQIARSRGPRS